tara:strand:- start:1339 stop:2034 length:696 start_codon:yes stop_codon:yes gene_type:complete
MESFKLSRELARLALLQRIELATSIQKKVRKFFGRFLFSKIISKYILNVNKISEDYYKIMHLEYQTIKNFLDSNQNVLSIGAGIGGLEVIINNNYIGTNFTFIERDFISKKIKYGWDNKNEEAYNKLDLLENFLISNNIKRSNFNIINFDKSRLPEKKFNLITSLYSLDFHYDFEIYRSYLSKVSDDKTIIIFDTIRSDFFKDIFEDVSVIKVDNDTLHKSKRIACRKFKK